MSTKKSKSSQSTRQTRSSTKFTPYDDQTAELLFPSLTSLSNNEASPTTVESSQLDKQLELTRLEKEKLALELEVLRLRANNPTVSEHEVKQDAKKRTIDWPQDFIPGSAGKVEFVNLAMPEFVAGFLCMIKKYDESQKARMHVILELIMIKAIDYSWPSVRGFYGHLAKLIESRRLEWEDVQEIREISTTFFKHSDLRTSVAKPMAPVANSNRISSNSSSTKGSQQSENTRTCQPWNYTGNCTCDKSALTFEQQHICRVCKAATHPMLHCPKRRMAIPSQ